MKTADVKVGATYLTKYRGQYVTVKVVARLRDTHHFVVEHKFLFFVRARSARELHHVSAR